MLKINSPSLDLNLTSSTETYVKQTGTTETCSLSFEPPKSLPFIFSPGELSMEELLRQYAGAFASDASAPGSENSEEDNEDEVEADSSDSEPEGATEADEAQEDSSSQSGECVVMRQELGRAGTGGSGYDEH